MSCVKEVPVSVPGFFTYQGSLVEKNGNDPGEGRQMLTEKKGKCIGSTTEHQQCDILWLFFFFLAIPKKVPFGLGSFPVDLLQRKHK